MTSHTHHQVLIVGGGTAGITVTAQLAKTHKLDIAVIDPADKHYYQPLWTLVGAGEFNRQVTEHDEASVIPAGVRWYQTAVAAFQPDQNVVETSDGGIIGYDWLVVAAGIQINWNQIKGLQSAIGKGGVCSNYAYEYVESTWGNIRSFQGGNAIFTQPAGAIKCGGAPQKIMYLAEDYFRKAGVRDTTNVIFASAGAGIFSVAKYKRRLEKVIERKGIDTRFRHNLVELRPESKQAVFEQLDTGEQVVLPYDMIHVTPPMSSPDFVAKSPLANDGGWVDVDRLTLKHTRYGNVFSLGDCSSLPTSKTGAAVRKQAPVLVANLKSAIQGRPLQAEYHGYTSCPIVTGYGKLILAEFDYDLQPVETFPFDQSKERYSMWLLKKYGLPLLYWRGMLKGRA